MMPISLNVADIPVPTSGSLGLSFWKPARLAFRLFETTHDSTKYSKQTQVERAKTNHLSLSTKKSQRTKQKERYSVTQQMWAPIQFRTSTLGVELICL